MKVAKSRIQNLLLILSVLLTSATASAVSNLKQVQVSGGSQIDLLFDGKIQRGQIQTEFFNDIIQVSLTDASVYPAKISSVSGGNVAKVFAYQYAPKLVRCRLTVKGKAEDFKDKLVLSTDGSGGKVLSIRVGAPSATVQAGTAAATSERSPDKSSDKSSDKPGEKYTDKINAQAGAAGNHRESRSGSAGSPDIEERALLSRVLAGSPAETAPGIAAPPSVKAVNTENLPIHTTPASGIPGAGALTSGKTLPSPLKAFGKMGLVLVIFAALAFALKRYARGGRGKGRTSDNGLPADISPQGLLGAISRFAKKGLAREKMIEVLSTHYLGPKKSIAVVRIAGKTMVLGIASDSINLISQLEGDGLDGAFLGESEGPSLSSGLGDFGFNDILSSAALQSTPKSGSRPAPKLPIAPTTAPRQAAVRYGQHQYGAVAPGPQMAPPASASVRAQIRTRMEGMKPL